MEANAKRTLVKSAPELWELADDVARLEGWMAGFVGVPGGVQVEVTERVPEQLIAWRALPSHGTHTQTVGFEQISIELAEKGFGTSVSVTARHAMADPAQAVAGLERLLDELASPERRPFSRG
jgi:hypothetical protein